MLSPRQKLASEMIRFQVANREKVSGLLYAAHRMGAPPLWVLAGAIVVVLPTFSGSFNAIGRFGLLAPAVFWGLASLGASRRTDTIIRSLSAVLLVAATVHVPFVFP